MIPNAVRQWVELIDKVIDYDYYNYNIFRYMLMFKLNSLIYKYIKQAPLFTSCTTVRLGQGRCFPNYLLHILLSLFFSSQRTGKVLSSLILYNHQRGLNTVRRGV